MPVMMREDGSGVRVPAVEVEDIPHNREQRLLRRAREWHRDVLEGRPNGRGGTIRKTVRYVAWLWGVHVDTVYEGLKLVQANLEAIRDVVQLECGDA